MQEFMALNKLLSHNSCDKQIGCDVAGIPMVSMPETAFHFPLSEPSYIQALNIAPYNCPARRRSHSRIGVEDIAS